MKARPYQLIDEIGYVPSDVQSATHIELHFPGPIPYRLIPVVPHLRGWTWNGDVDRPTISPSILTRTTMRIDGKTTDVICHSFVRDGQVEFLSDCTHELAGQLVELLEVEI